MKGVKLKKFEQFMGGLHWVYENKKGDTLSIICHIGCYGWEYGLFEVMASWQDCVEGNLTFEDVAHYLNILKKRGTNGDGLK